MTSAFSEIRRLSDSVRGSRLAESGYTAGRLISEYLALPGLRAFWPFSSIDEAGKAYDLSGQGRVLSSAAYPAYATVNGVPYALFNGSSQYLTRADEAGLDISGALTVGGWVYQDDRAAAHNLLSKWNSVGAQRAYTLISDATPNFQFQVSTDGNIGPYVLSLAADVLTATWQFVVGRFTPSTEIKLIVDDNVYTSTTAIPATIFNSSAPFSVGVYGSLAASFLPGRMAMPFVCAAAVGDEVLDNLYQESRHLFGV